jgi:hypothetical protein
MVASQTAPFEIEHFVLFLRNTVCGTAVRGDERRTYIDKSGEEMLAADHV